MKLRGYFVTIIIASLLPVLIFVAIMITLFARQEQNAVETGLIHTTRALSLAVDHELGAWIDTLAALATSEYLESEDLKRFYSRSQRVLDIQDTWETIVLVDPSGQQLVNLRIPFGSTLPQTGAPDLIRQVAETGKPAVSNLFHGPVADWPVIALGVPVFVSGQLKYILTSSASPAFLNRILQNQKLPAGWLATILDKNRIIVARTRNPKKFIGTPATPNFAAKSRESTEMTWRGVTRDGQHVLAGLHRSELSGWTVGLALPIAMLEAPMRRSLLYLAGGGFLLLTLGGVFAGLLARKVTRPISALSAAAAALGRGEALKIKTSGIIEVDRVSRGLENAAATRKQAAEGLMRSEHRFRAIFEQAGIGVALIDSATGKFVEINQRYCDIVGYTPEEMTALTFQEITHPDDLQADLDNMAKLNAGEIRQFSMEKRYYRKDRSVAWVALSVSPTWLPGEPSHTHIAMVDDITNRKSAEEQFQRNLRQIRALHEINNAITSSLELDSRLAILLEKIDLFFPDTAATVRLVNRQTGELEAIACRNLPEAEWKQEFTPRPGAFARRLAVETSPTIIRNLQTESTGRHRDYFRRHGLVSYIRAPLIVQKQVVGLLAIYSWKHREFNNEEIDFLKGLAAQAAIAIQNSQLFEEMKHSQSELESTNRRLESTLREVSKLYGALAPLAPAESTPQLMDTITERLMEATGADAAVIRVWDKHTGAFLIAGQRGFPDFYLERIHTRPTGGAVEWVFENHDAIIAPDIASEPRLRAKTQLEAGFRSCAMLPLQIYDEIRGIILLSSRTPGYFDEAQKDHLTAIARQMAISLENRQLFDDLRISRDELEKANKVKDEFLSVMSHELRTPLNVIIGYAGLLREKEFGDLNVDQERPLDKIILQSRELLTMITGILEATQIGATKIRSRADVVRPAHLLDRLRATSDVPPNKPVKLVWEYPRDLPQIMTDEDKLKRILQNLVNNAIKYTHEGKVAISARYLEQEHLLEFQVTDTGDGIAEENLPIIFEMFRQVDSSETRIHGGVGLGLFIVKKYTELLGGEVRVESDLGRGTTFTVTLPCERPAA